MKFNPSMIKRWMSCGLSVQLASQFESKVQVSGNMAFGTAVHSALEAYNEGLSVEDSVKFFLKIWDDPKMLTEEIDYFFPRTSHPSFREKGIQIIEDYADTKKWEAREIIATEHRFAVPFGRHVLSGIVDYLEYEKATDTLRIIDLKTGRRLVKDQLHVDPQFTAYCYAVTQKEFWVGNPEEGERYKGFEDGEKLFEKFRDSKHVAIWYDLQKNQEVDVGPRGEVDFVRLYRCCDEIERAIEHNVYVPNISGESCRWCDFKEVCPAYVMPENSGKDLDE